MTTSVVFVVYFLVLVPSVSAQSNDFDLDGMSDAEEARLGLDPYTPDMDGDGYLDGEEFRHGYDPRNPAPEKIEKRITIDRTRQQLAYAVGPYVLGEHPVSTGKPRTPTPAGTFRIASKQPRAWSNRAGLWMPWWVNFTGPRAPAGRYGIHELPEWRGGRKEGEEHLGTPVSGGCVRLGVGVAKRLYDWAEIGTVVDIR